MRITPLDLRNHRFQRRMRGYDRVEVDDFLQVASEDYETALRKTDQQAARIRELEQRVQDLSANEKIVQDILATAQKLSDDLKRTAVKEAEVLIGEAEIRGEKVLEVAHRRAAKLADDIREMKLVKMRLSAAVRSAIQTHLALLETLASDPPEEAAAPARGALDRVPPEPPRLRKA
jgi:cell division initiation protein